MTKFLKESYKLLKFTQPQSLLALDIFISELKLLHCLNAQIILPDNIGISHLVCHKLIIAKMQDHKFPRSHSTPKGHGGKVVMEFVDKIYNETPGFQDIFDEETFYMFAAGFTILTCVAAFIASRYITIKARE